MKTLQDLGEDGFIEFLRQEFTLHESPLTGECGKGILRGIGDDTSVTVSKSDPSRATLITTDTLVEGTHFTIKHSSPRLLGKKAVSVSLSDVAAMGASPSHLLVALTLKPSTTESYIKELYNGIKDCIDEFKVTLIGGNTTSTDGPMVITTTLVGHCDTKDIIYRSGANVGNLIFVTGSLGDSALGLRQLQAMGDKKLSYDECKGAVLSHLSPTPRCEAGPELSKRGLATAMIDISDGLLKDTRRIMDESRVGALIEVEELPLSKELSALAAEKPANINLALAGGEDYELLFTAKAEDTVEVATLSKELNLKITEIGRIVEKSEGLKVIDKDGALLKTELQGYEHFS
jgi:thiamine-monophosphate kinase